MELEIELHVFECCEIEASRRGFLNLRAASRSSAFSEIGSHVVREAMWSHVVNSHDLYWAHGSRRSMRCMTEDLQLGNLLEEVLRLGACRPLQPSRVRSTLRRCDLTFDAAGRLRLR